MVGGQDWSHSYTLISDAQLDTTEVFSYKTNAWTEGGRLPVKMWSMGAATINNRLLLLGIN